MLLGSSPPPASERSTSAPVPRKAGLPPHQLLASVPKPSPGADGAGAWRVRDCSDPRTGTRAGLQPLVDQGSDPPSSRCRTTLAAVSLPSLTLAGLFLAAIGCVVPHGRKGCLTGVNGDGNPGGVPRFPSSPGARGSAAGGCACSGNLALPSQVSCVLARGQETYQETTGQSGRGSCLFPLRATGLSGARLACLCELQ